MYRSNDPSIYRSICSSVWRLLGCVLLCALPGIAPVVAAPQDLAAGEYACAEPIGHSPGPHDAEVYELLRLGKLDEALRMAGHVDRVFDMFPESRMPVSGLPVFVRRTPAILIGSLSNSRCYVSSNRTTVQQGVTVTVETTLKGSLQPGSRFTFASSGGRIIFPDGTWMQTSYPQMVPLADGQRWLLFVGPMRAVPGPALAARAGASGVFDTTDGAYGLFEITADGRLQSIMRDPQVRLKDTVAAAYQGQPLEKLVAAIREADKR
jgi:hypothetical protein